MNKGLKFLKNNEGEIMTYFISFLILFIPLKDMIAEYTINYVKMIPDIFIIIMFIYILVTRKQNIKMDKTDIVVLIFIIFSFITSVLLNKRNMISYIFEIRALFLYYSLYYSLKHIDKKNVNYDKLLNVLEFMIILLSVFAIIEKIFNKTILFPHNWAMSITSPNNFPRVYSLLKNPNTFAFFNFLSFVILTLNYKKCNKTLFVFILCLIFNNLWFCSSRSTLLIMGTYCILMLILNYKKIFNKINVKICLCVVLLSFALISSTSSLTSYLNVEFVRNNSTQMNPDTVQDEPQKPDKNQNDKIPNSSNQQENINGNGDNKQDTVIIEPEKKGSLLLRIKNVLNGKQFINSKIDGRLYKISKGIQIFKDNMFIGSGFGTYGDAASLTFMSKDVYKQYKIPSRFYADNFYMVILVETGILGILQFTIWMLFLFQKIWNCKYKVISLCSVLLFGFFTNVFEIQIVNLLLILILMMNNTKLKS